MKKKIITLTLTLVMAAAMGTTAYAQGWQQDTNGWWYGTNPENSTWHTNGWQWIDANQDNTAECYYFDGNGYLMTNTTTPDGHTVNADGAWVVSNTVQTQPVVQQTSSGYKNKISTVIWDLMDHTYAENQQTYGKFNGTRYEGHPYEMYYYTGMLKEEEMSDFTPYIIVVNSNELPLNMIFEDAPDINIYTSLEAIAEKLEDSGYEVMWGTTNLRVSKTCWVTVDRFDISFAHNTDGSFDIKVRQELSEMSAKAMNDAFNMPLS